jgi:ADYC domain-containing protein/pentapeptide repeat protein
MFRTNRYLLCSAALALGACAAPPGDGGGSSLSRAATSLNGTSLNGTSLNGTSLNGTSLNGTSLNGASLNGASLNGTSLNGTSLNGTSLNGTSLNGTSLNGVSLNGVLSNGETLPMHVDSIVQGAGSDGDIFYYAVSYKTAQGWQPLCGVEQDGSAVLAIPLAGRWNEAQGVPGGGSHIDDPSVITFACLHKAIAKCVQWGYKPWKAVNGVSLAAYHQACTRLVRADYCGDGVSWTQNGTVIDLYDGLAIQTDSEPSWKIEAEFDASGARCVDRDRIKALHTIDGGNPHACLDARADDGRCGDPSHFQTGTLMMVRDPRPESDTGGLPLLPH